MKSNNRHSSGQPDQENRRLEQRRLEHRRLEHRSVRRPGYRHARKSFNRPLPLALVISLDILLVGVGLVVFALFHHVFPRDIGLAGKILPQQTISASAGSTDLSPDVTDPLNGSTDGTLSSTAPSASAGATGSTTAKNSSTTTSSSSTASSTTSPSTTGAPFAVKFKDKFTTGAVEKTDTSYKSAHVNVSVKKVQAGSIAYVVTDIYVSDIRFFRTAFASGKYARGVTASVLTMATANHAVSAISGDYYGIRDKGIVIRNGVLYRDTIYKDVLIMNNDGSMQTFTADQFSIDRVLKQGAWQGWSFGPMLLTDGKPMTSFNSDVTAANPRGAIGYYEPGHYCFVLVDGRQDGYSVGMTMKQLSQLFYDLGCKVAYNLDGGQSAVLTFMDAVANSPYKGGRQISDIVYIADQ